jgi:hypothetical protein
MSTSPGVVDRADAGACGDAMRRPTSVMDRGRARVRARRRCGPHRLSSVPANPRLGRAVVDTLNGRKSNRHLPPKNRDHLDELNSVCVEDRLNMPYTGTVTLVSVGDLGGFVG